MKAYEYDAVIRVDPDSGGAYVPFPWDLREEFGKGRIRVHAEFDQIPYDGSIVNMGVRNADGSICYVIGILKTIRSRLGKGEGDSVHVKITAAPELKPLWKCPACGREFSRQNQDHYCVKPQDIDAYIRAQAEAVQPRLREIRALIRAAIPDAEERISWSMPTYWKARNIIHFAASRKNIGLYPGGEATTVFAEELKGYDVSKGTIRLPYDQELPAELIARIAQWCYEKYRRQQTE